MTSSLGFDVAAGMSETTINAMLPQIYKALYPNFLKGNAKVREAGIASVDYDIQSVPVVSLKPSAKATEKIRCSLKDHCSKVAQAISSEILAAAASATLSAKVSKVALTINYSNMAKPTTVSTSLEVHAAVLVKGSKLTPKLLTGSVSIPDNPILQDLLNKALLPYLIDLLDKDILSPIKIPPIGYKSLHLSTPLPIVRYPYLTAYSALGSKPAKSPSSISWPSDTLYIAADSATLEAAAGIIFPLGPQENFDWKIFSGHVGATINKPTVLSINSDGSISARIEANTSCQLIMHTGVPFIGDIKFGPSATAGLSMTMRPLVEAGELKIVPEGIPIPSFSFDWGIPNFIDWLFSPLRAGLAAALNAVLGPLIAQSLDIPGIPVFSIPGIPIKFNEKTKIKLTIDKATPRGLNGLLVVEGQVSVTKLN